MRRQTILSLVDGELARVHNFTIDLTNIVNFMLVPFSQRLTAHAVVIPRDVQLASAVHDARHLVVVVCIFLAAGS